MLYWKELSWADMNMETTGEGEVIFNSDLQAQSIHPSYTTETLESLQED